MQKSPTAIGFAITFALSAVGGAIPTGVLASAENGYVAGYAVLPLFLLVAIVCLALFIGAIVFIGKEKFAIGLYFLVSVLLIPTFWITSASLAKHFEIGAYRIDPIRPIIPPIANKIIFKKSVTDDEVQEFWRNTLSIEHPGGGSMSLPGVQAISTALPEDGHEILLFSFFENATEDQKALVRDRILASQKVLQLKENTEISRPNREPVDGLNTNEAKRRDSKVVIVK